MRNALRFSLFALTLGASLCLVGCGAPTGGEVSLPWQESLAAAKSKAQAENKKILINFTGSDWCGWCVRLRREVFSRNAFAAYATNKFILVEIDFPRAKAQSPERKKANDALAQRFQVEEFPTILLLDQYGRQLGRTSYVRGGSKAFIGELEKITTGQIKNVVEEEADKSLIPGLTLKGISGIGDARLALINNLTLRSGESGTVRSGARKVEVHCVDIREYSVVVTIDRDETPKELRLSGRL